MSPPSEVRLEPMDPPAFDEFRRWMVTHYAQENVRSGRFAPEGAEARSETEIRHLLPQGAATPDHQLFLLRSADSGQVVGELWIALRRDGAAPELFIYWIGVHAEHRRRGFAEAALRAVEQEARRLGASRIGLHVFASNVGAQALYRKMGYEATGLLMVRSVPGA